MQKLLLGSIVLAMVAGCGDDGGTGAAGATGAGGASAGGSAGEGGAVVVETLTVRGTVVDLESGDPVTSSATMSVSGLNPAPAITVTGADFEMSGVAPFSAFNLLAGAPPDYRTTYNVLTEVADMDVEGVDAQVVSEAFLTSLQTGFGVTPAAGTGVLLALALDEQGNPRDGVPGSAFSVPGADGPYFLDDAMLPDAGATETSASGWVVFYDVAPGLIEVTASDNSGYSITGAASPVAATTVTLAELTVKDGELVIPTNVSFSTDVVPLFEIRGCTACHSGSSIGADLGGLSLNGGDQKIYSELAEEISENHGTLRVNTLEPELSLVLRMPGYESPPDEHPNVTFASQSDPAYLILLGWITEGALNN